MTEVPSRDTQLDRMDKKLDQVLDRLSRMEERQESHGGKLESHAVRLDEHSGRLRDVEIAHAVAVATGKQENKAISGRWAVIGAASLVVLGSIGAFVGNLIIVAVRNLIA